MMQGKWLQIAVVLGAVALAVPVRAVGFNASGEAIFHG